MYEKLEDKKHEPIEVDGTDSVKLSFKAETASRACAYTRDYVYNGCTWLKNNDNPNDEMACLQRNALYHAITDLRTLWQDQSASFFESQMPDSLYKLKKATAPSKKYGLGNCMEMAFIAFEYILEHSPSVNAEVYHIDGGDHAFVVVGRHADSDPSNPETWGEDAYICDPWADKVYPASQYLENLNNFYCKARDVHVGCIIVSSDSEPTLENIQQKDKYHYIMFEDRFWYYDCAQNLLTEIECAKEKVAPSCLTELPLGTARPVTLQELSAIKFYLDHTNGDYATFSEPFDTNRHKLAAIPFLNTGYFGKLQTIHLHCQFLSSLYSTVARHFHLPQGSLVPVVQLIEGLTSSLIHAAEESKYAPPTPNVQQVISTGISSIRQQMGFFKKTVDSSSIEQQGDSSLTSNPN